MSNNGVTPRIGLGSSARPPQAPIPGVAPQAAGVEQGARRQASAGSFEAGSYTASGQHVDANSGFHREAQAARARADQLNEMRLAQTGQRNDELFYDSEMRFNPVTAGARVAHDSRMFNAAGQINSYDSRGPGLWRTVSGYFAAVEAERKAAQLRKPSDYLSREVLEERNHIIREASKTVEGMQRIAQSASKPIKPLMAFEAVDGDVLERKDIQEGERWFPNKDIGRPLVHMLGRDGAVEAATVIDNVVTPKFHILQSSQKVGMYAKQFMDFDVLSRMEEVIREEMLRQRMRLLMRAIDANSALVNPAVLAPGSLDTANIETARKYLESDNAIADKMIMMRQRLSDFITDISGEVDPVTQRELLMQGVAGHYLGVAIKVVSGGGHNGQSGTGIFDPQRVYMMTSKEHIGYYGVARDLTVQPFNMVQLGSTDTGLLASMMIAFAIMEPKNLVRISVVS